MAHELHKYGPKTVVFRVNSRLSRALFCIAPSYQLTSRPALPSPPGCFGKPCQASSQLVKDSACDIRSPPRPYKHSCLARPHCRRTPESDPLLPAPIPHAHEDPIEHPCQVVCHGKASCPLYSQLATVRNKSRLLHRQYIRNSFAQTALEPKPPLRLQVSHEVCFESFCRHAVHTWLLGSLAADIKTWENSQVLCLLLSHSKDVQTRAATPAPGPPRYLLRAHQPLSCSHLIIWLARDRLGSIRSDSRVFCPAPSPVEL